MSKVLFLINASSGLYDFRNTLVKALLDRGDEVIACFPNSRAESEEPLRAEGVKIIKIDMNRRGVNPKEDLKLMKTYRDLLKKEKPDVVLTYTIKPNCYGGFICGRLGIPYLETVTGLGSAFQKQGPVRKLIVTLYRMGMKKSACVFFQNQENLNTFASLGICGRKSKLVSGSGVDLVRHSFEPYEEHFAPYTEFLYLGRLMKEKGTFELLEAARHLKEKYGEQFVLRAVGYADDPECQDVVEKAIADGILKTEPFSSDVHPYLKSADAVVLPSWHEGMSNVVLEASATGRAVIASDIAGIREGVEDGVTGLLFPKQDAKALESAMEKFLRMSLKERQAMGRAAREKMEREFDRRRVTDSYLEEINAAVGCLARGTAG